jgi:hypothetical protein
MHQTQQEIHHHINAKIAYTLEGYSPDLSIHDIDSSTVEWKCQNISNIQLKYIKDSKISINCDENIEKANLSYITKSAITIVCEGNDHDSINLSYLSDSIITIICKGNDNYPIHLSRVKNVTIKTNSKNVKHTIFSKDLIIETIASDTTKH